MADKDLTFDRAQRHAFEVMSSPTRKDGSPNKFYVPAAMITMPAFLIQEQPLTAANPIMTFDFSSNGPKPNNVLNNIVIGENDAVQNYAWQLLIGYGATKNVRQYYSYGLSISDDVVYKSKMSMKFETNDLITQIDTNVFRYENGTVQQQYDGTTLINPQRQFSGRNSRLQVVLDMGDVSTLTFTPNAFVSVRLWVCLGASSATN